MQEKPDCELCEELKQNKPTPCDKCLPELMPENLEAWKIYVVCSGQLIVGSGGPIDINHQAVHEALRLYDIQDKRGCFERVILIARHMIAKMNERIERESRHRTSSR